MKNIVIFCIIILILIIMKIKTKRKKYSNKRKTKKPKIYGSALKEYFSDKNKLFQDMLDNHYHLIFPNNANRNSAGFRFFKYFYDNLAINEELFDIYNTFYCSVSGSIVSPDRSDNYSILKVKQLGTNKCVIGKYYRCCVPCNCDIMKYARIVQADIEIPKNSGNFYKKNLITIGDPCISKKNLPSQLDSNVFKCKNNNLELGYRINNRGELTMGKGRLVVGVLYPLNENDKHLLSESVNGCLTGTKRFLSNEDNLEYGMGDIFVKLALLNDDNTYTHTESDFCSM